MSHNLLHGRRLGGDAASGVVASPAYGSLSSADDGFGSNFATASVAIHVLPDGTWLGDSDGGADKSGNWYLPATADIGADYLVRITPTLSGGSSAVITNDAGGAVSLATTRQIELTLSRHTVGVSEANYNVKIEILTPGGVVVSTGIMAVFLHAQAQGDDPPEGL